MEEGQPQQAAAGISTRQDGWREGEEETPMGLILTSWGLVLGEVLGLVLSSFFSLGLLGELLRVLFEAIHVVSFACLPVFVIFLATSKNKTARINGVVLLVLLLAVCGILGAKFD